MDEILKAAEALTTAELEELIQKLGRRRGTLEPKVPSEIPLGVPVVAVGDPRFWIEPDAMQGGTTLGLRHPWFGYLWFVFPPDARSKLIAAMQIHSQDAEMLNAPPPHLN